MRADRGMFVPRQPRSQFLPKQADPPRRPPARLIERLVTVEKRVDTIWKRTPGDVIIEG